MEASGTLSPTLAKKGFACIKGTGRLHRNVLHATLYIGPMTDSTRPPSPSPLAPAPPPHTSQPRPHRPSTTVFF